MCSLRSNLALRPSQSNRRPKIPEKKIHRTKEDSEEHRWAAQHQSCYTRGMRENMKSANLVVESSTD